MNQPFPDDPDLFQDVEWTAGVAAHSTAREGRGVEERELWTLRLLPGELLQDQRLSMPEDTRLTGPAPTPDLPP